MLIPELITILNSRLGVTGLELVIEPIDNMVDYCFRYFLRYKRLGVSNSTNIPLTLTSNSHIFNAPAPDRINSIFDTNYQQYYRDWCYSKPILSNMYPGDFLVEVVSSTPIGLGDITTLHDLLEDMIFGEYCKVINNALNLGKLDIPLTVDTIAIIQHGQSLSDTARDSIIEQKDLE